MLSVVALAASPRRWRRSLGRLCGMKWLVILCALILAPYVAWKIAYPTYTHRFRLVIEVEANGEVKRGSSVIEVSQTGIPEAFYVTGKGSTAPQAKGEAVFVDLGQGRNVVALFGYGPTASNSDRIAFLAAQAFDLDGNHAWRTLPNMQGRRELIPRLIPTLVTMPNVKDASSAAVVAPEDFPKFFGPDVRFLRAWVELTRPGYEQPQEGVSGTG